MKPERKHMGGPSLLVERSPFPFRFALRDSRTRFAQFLPKPPAKRHRFALVHELWLLAPLLRDFDVTRRRVVSFSFCLKGFLGGRIHKCWCF